jgi:predicted secreted protein
MTSGVVNGTNLRIYLEGTPIGYATSCQLTMNREMREILTKDSPGSGWGEKKPGQKSASLTTECFYSDSTTNVAPDTLFGYFDAGTALAWTFTTTVTGDTFYTGSAYISSIDYNSPVEDNVSFTVTFDVNGAITSGTET